MTYVSEVNGNLPEANAESKRDVFYTSIVFGCKVLLAVFETKRIPGAMNNYMTTPEAVDFFVFNSIGEFNKWRESDKKTYPPSDHILFDEFLNAPDAHALVSFFESVQDLIQLKQSY